MTVVQIWKCDKCGFVYKSPIEITAISHKCGTPMTVKVLRLVTVSQKIVEVSE